MLQVYAIPVSLYCAKLRILLRHKGLVWQEVPPPGGYGSSEYRRIVPAGNLPALLDGAMLLADSEAIAEYLNEMYPEPPMLPEQPFDRALVRERSRYHDTRLEPAVRSMFPFFSEASRSGFEPEKHTDTLTDRLAGMAGLLEKHPASDMLTLGDCGFPITLCWLELLIQEFDLPLEIPEPVLAYRDDLLRFQAVSDEIAEYRGKVLEWLKIRVLQDT